MKKDIICRNRYYAKLIVSNFPAGKIWGPEIGSILNYYFREERNNEL